MRIADAISPKCVGVGSHAQRIDLLVLIEVSEMQWDPTFSSNAGIISIHNVAHM